MFRWFRRKKVDEVLKKIDKKNLLQRYALLLVGCFIVAFSFNVFFLQYSIVCFGVSGVSIILNQFGVNPSIFILVANIILLIISYLSIYKGFKDSETEHKKSRIPITQYSADL